MSASGTPRSSAAWQLCGDICDRCLPALNTLAGVGKDLEYDLAAAHARIAELVAWQEKVQLELVWPLQEKVAELERERDGLRKECDSITELNHGQFLQLEFLRRIYVAADALYSESEEYDFDDGLGRGASQVFWDALADSFEPETDAIKAELDAAMAEKEPPHAEAAREWRCFHCDEVFTDINAARAHFGASDGAQPACQIDAAEYRAMEARMLRYNEEDSDLHREIARLEAAHAIALRREEEAGYARGLKDGRALAAEQGMVSVPCQWMQDGEGNYWSDCGNGFTFIDGGPKENEMQYCCYCGKVLAAHEKEPKP